MTYAEFKAAIRAQFPDQPIDFQGSAWVHKAVIDRHYIALGSPSAQNTFFFDGDRYLGVLAL